MVPTGGRGAVNTQKVGAVEELGLEVEGGREYPGWRKGGRQDVTNLLGLVSPGGLDSSNRPLGVVGRNYPIYGIGNNSPSPRLPSATTQGWRNDQTASSGA